MGLLARLREWRSLMWWAEREEGTVLLIPLSDNPSLFYTDPAEALYSLEQMKDWLPHLIEELKQEADIAEYSKP